MQCWTLLVWLLPVMRGRRAMGSDDGLASVRRGSEARWKARESHRLRCQLGATLDLLAVPHEESSSTVLIGPGDLQVDHAFCFLGAMHFRPRANDLN